MTQEEKQLLLKDICARLPFGVMCQIDYDNEEDSDLGIERYCDDRIVSVCVETEEIGLYEASGYFYPDDIKPYLRPMSSMTEEEDHEFALLQVQGGIDECKYLYACDAVNMVAWLNRHHFDYNGLIDKGLALEAPEGLYNN